MNEMKQGDYMIEGLGNDVLIVTAIITSLIPLLLYFCKRRRPSARIHPDSAANVESTRAHLSLQADSNHSSNHDGSHGVPAKRAISEELSCPVCLGEAVFAVETNCSHVFCGACIIAYWRHQQWLGAVPCPACRTQVTLLLLYFTSAESADTSASSVHTRDEINNYNRRFSGQPRALIEILRDFPTLLCHALSEFLSPSGLFFMFRVRFVVSVFAALAYFIIPFDIINDAAYGFIGFIDDAVVFVLMAVYISCIYRQVVEARARRGNDDVAAT